MLTALRGASLGVRACVYAALAAALAAMLWWAIGAPRVALAGARADLATLQARHAALTDRLAEAEAAAAEKSTAVRAAYDAGVKSAATMRDKETADAYQRGKDTGQRIAAGAQRVRVQWRDCPAAPEGAGAGPAGGASEVAGSRSEGIGRVLGIAGAADAQYAEVIRRLEAAQAIVDACFEEPAG